MTRADLAAALAALNGNELRSLLAESEKIRLEKRREQGRNRQHKFRQRVTQPSRSSDAAVTLTEGGFTEESNASVTQLSRSGDGPPSPSSPLSPVPPIPSPSTTPEIERGAHEPTLEEVREEFRRCNRAGPEHEAMILHFWGKWDSRRWCEPAGVPLDRWRSKVPGAVANWTSNNEQRAGERMPRTPARPTVETTRPGRHGV